MPGPTPGFVKNMIRRSFREIVDSSPTKRDRAKIWDFFNSKCAYCGKKLIMANKEGHIDHLVSSARDGANHISNRVLSCAPCNEKEKLDMAWSKFLKLKNPDKAVLKKRKERIMQWQKENGQLKLNETVLETIDLLSEEVVEFYDRKIEIARQLKNGNIQQFTPADGAGRPR